jgi:hypothetical protein
MLENSASARPTATRPRRGVVALTNTVTPPWQAMVDDLLFVRGVLERAGIQFMLIRGNDERPTIVVDIAESDRIRAALVADMANEPFVLKTEGKKAGPAVLVADGLLSLGRADRAFVLYRPRETPRGGLRYGASSGVRMETWLFGDDALETPVESALTRRRIPRSEFVETTVERYGCTWRTIDRMFDTLSSDVTFDIDMVFSWVDGTDVEFQRARARRMQSYVVGEGDDHAARFRQIDELRYALRSVHLFAPWVRRIFIVTDSPTPYWLDEHPGVTVVRSEDFFADPSVLPTHNSHAVESQLHLIPGIAEHFLYSNDDMFFGRAVTPDMFFSPGGVTKFVEATTRIGLGSSTPQRSGFENAARVNRALLSERFGITITRHLEHCAAPLTKRVMTQLAEEFPEEFRRTAASRFRSATDVSVTNSLYHYYALATGSAVVQTEAKVKYVDTTMREGLVAMQKLLAKRNVDMFCLNDGSFPEISAEERAAEVGAFLEDYFPISAPWEKLAVEEASRAV